MIASARQPVGALRCLPRRCRTDRGAGAPRRRALFDTIVKAK